MRIAYVCADAGIPVYGQKGSSVHVQEVIRALLKKGHDVTLFANQTHGDPPTGLESVRLVQLPRYDKSDNVERERNALQADQQVAALLGLFGPFDLVYERYALWSFSALSSMRACGVPTLLEVNAPLIEEQKRYRILHDQDAAMAASANAFAAADTIVAVSKEVADYLSRYPQTQGKVQIVPNGVNSDRFANAVQLRQSHPHPFTIGFVGTLKPWHGVQDLLFAFSTFLHDVPESRLLIVGDGPEGPHLQAQCAALKISHQVEFTGSVSPADVAGQLARMDVGTAPYPMLDEFYFSPLKVYEYLAAGIPVVASDIGQLGDIIRQSSGGLLHPPGDVSAICDALHHYHKNPMERARVGAHARSVVVREHDWDAVTSRLLELAVRSIPTTNKIRSR